MAPKRIWKNLDEYYGSPAVDQARSSEFTPEVGEALREFREQRGIDEEGRLRAEAHAPLATALADVGPATTEPEADADTLRRHLPLMSRRGFLQLSGAATVFGMAGCWHNPPQTLVPYQQHPEGHVLGKADIFSTTLRSGGKPVPVTAKCYDFRPIKLEGNPDASWTRGRLDLAGQASLLDLYDPDRVYSVGQKSIEGPLQADGNGGFVGTSWAALDMAVGGALKACTVGLLTPPLSGPAHAALIKDLKAVFGDRLRHAAWQPHAGDRLREARGVVLGAAAAKADPVYHLDRADVIVSLGSDLLGGGELGLGDHVAFGDQRRLKHAGHHADMGSFIAFEPMLTQGGTCADLRARVPMADMASVGWAIAVGVAEGLGRLGDLPAWAADEAKRGNDVAPSHPTLAQAGRTGMAASPVTYAVEQLLAAHKAGTHSLVYAGGAVHQGADSLPVLVVATVINQLLGNEGVTIGTADAPASAIPASQRDTEALFAACTAGAVSTLIVVDSNPVFALGDQAADAIAGVRKAGGLVVACNDRVDETAALADWVAPITHDLESWGDAETRLGQYCFQQPVILPLWDVRQWQESLLSFCVAGDLGRDRFAVDMPESPLELRSAASRQYLWVAENNGVRSWQATVRSVWGSQVRSACGSALAAESFVRECQAKGLVTAAVSANAPAPGLDAAAVAQHRPGAAHDGYTLVISPSRTLGDGRNANNAWLQETSDPVSKVTWDTWLAVNIKDAKELMVRDNSVVAVSIPGRTQPILVPVLVQPGQDQGTLELFSGFGRTRAGAVAAGGGVDGIQVNAFELIQDGNRWFGLDADAVNPTGDTYELACTQFHQYMDGRDIALDDVLEAHVQDPDFHKRHHPHIFWSESTSDNQSPNHSGHNLSLYQQSVVYPGRRWGMVIDLGTCTGCNACVVACSAENNVPVVGRDEVRLGREMHWIRIDRYYTANSISRKDEKYKGVKASETVAQEDPEDVEVIHQPMVCQQCGHAPCEEVCPAMATMHNDEGLNIQVYNRCIGTRYCANNCPYKVRRFNFYEYSKYRFGPQGSGDPFGRIVTNLTQEGSTTSQAELSKLPLNMLLNPNVTLRSKGVMEKCNFCVQRTREIREDEKRSNRKYDDTAPDAVTTACAQTCPTGAITFGDINDDQSMVARLSDASPHKYKVLDTVLNTRPSVNYLRKVRNRPATEDEQYGLTGHGGGQGTDAEHGENGEAH